MEISFIPNAPVWFTFILVAAILLLLIFTNLAADVLFPAGLAILCISGILTPKEAFGGFASSGVITVGILYVVVAGLEESGTLTWITKYLLGMPRSKWMARIRVVAPVSLLSAFLNNTPVVAMFIPAIRKWSQKIQINPSQLLIPLSYSAILGGTTTLIGTSTNLVVNGLVIEHMHNDGLGIFEISVLGVPVALAGLLYLVFAAKWLLPDREEIDTSFQKTREYTVEMLVPGKSNLAGKSLQEAGLHNLPGGFVAEIIRDGKIIVPVPSEFVLQKKDRLVFVGLVDSILELQNTAGLKTAADTLFSLNSKTERHLVEVVVSNTCPFIGKPASDESFRKYYNAAMLAIARNGERPKGGISKLKLRPGDTLLLETHGGFIPRQKDSGDFYLTSEVHHYYPVNFKKAPLAAFILGGMVLLASTGTFDMLRASMLGAFAMVATGCVSIGRARKSLQWSILVVIASAMGIGKAMETTGAASYLAETVFLWGKNNPYTALICVYVVTALLTEVITNNAAAVLVFPIAFSTAQSLGVNPIPFAMVLMVAASASFSTPVGYQTNLMVYGPGGYKYTDYFRIGAPLSLLVGAMVIFLAPRIWPF